MHWWRPKLPLTVLQLQLLAAGLWGLGAEGFRPEALRKPIDQTL
jgi:hypothetical protein